MIFYKIIIYNCYACRVNIFASYSRLGVLLLKNHFVPTPQRPKINQKKQIQDSDFTTFCRLVTWMFLSMSYINLTQSHYKTSLHFDHFKHFFKS
jgi:hypothetical protein